MTAEPTNTLSILYTGAKVVWSDVDPNWEYVPDSVEKIISKEPKPFSGSLVLIPQI